MSTGFVADDVLTADELNTAIKFGGDGSDGALAISSGTTDIDVGGAAVFIKNFTSISITGTGKLTFSNPHANGTIVILRSQGDVTITSSSAPCIDMSAMGAEAGTGGAGINSSAGPATEGTDGLIGNGLLNPTGIYYGQGDKTAGVILERVNEYATSLLNIITGLIRIACGSGGAGGRGGTTTGGSGAPTGGDGGRGGGGLYIECAGAWNFTTALGISVAGENGQDGGDISTSNESVSGAGAGAGGAAGFFIALYHTLTANSGTIDSSGGDSGTGGDATTSGGGGSSTDPQSGHGGGGAASDKSAGGVGANPRTGTGNGFNGTAPAGNKAGAGAPSGGARRGDAGAGTNTGGVLASGGVSDNVLVAENIYIS